MVKYLLVVTSFSLLPSLIHADLRRDAEEAAKKGGGNTVVYINPTPHILQVTQRAYPSAKALPEGEYIHNSVQPYSFFVVDPNKYPGIQGERAEAEIYIMGGTGELSERISLNNLPGWGEKKYHYSIAIHKLTIKKRLEQPRVRFSVAGQKLD